MMMMPHTHTYQIENDEKTVVVFLIFFYFRSYSSFSVSEIKNCLLSLFLHLSPQSNTHTFKLHHYFNQPKRSERHQMDTVKILFAFKDVDASNVFVELKRPDRKGSKNISEYISWFHVTKTSVTRLEFKSWDGKGLLREFAQGKYDAD